MTKVYVVTSGEYSAYRIERIFATKEAADAYAALCNEDRALDGHNVEEHDLLDEVPAHKRLHRWAETLYLDDSPMARYSRPAWNSCEWVFGPEAEAAPAIRTRVNVHRHNLAIYIEVRGTDEERVNKTFSEVRARVVAEADLLRATCKAQDGAGLASVIDRVSATA